MGQAPSHPTSEPPEGWDRRWVMPAGPPTAGDAPAAATAPAAGSATAPPPPPAWSPAPPAAPTSAPTAAFPQQYLPPTYQTPNYQPPAYPAPGAGYPTVPPTVPPGRPPTWPPYGAQPQPTPEAPRRRPALAGVALIALIAIVLGLTAGVTIDRALQDRDQRVDASSPFSRPSTSNGTSNGNSASNDPGAAGGGLVQPGQGGSDPASSGSACTTSAPSESESADIAGKVTPGVVNINTMLGYQQAAAAGTGMILTSDGLVLTNNHVVDSSTVIKATVVGTGDTYTAKVLGTAKTLDVALIQLVDAHDLPTVKIDKSKPSNCDPIVAAGNAGGKGGDPSVVSGIVTALDKSITASDENGGNQETLHELIETNAPIQPGDSGGPLIDTDGEVIGMNTAASAQNQFQSVRSVGYAIPIANALEVVEQIKAGKESDTVRLGLPGIMGVQLDPDSQGAVVIGAASGSPAEDAGLVAGSTITTVNGKQVDSAEAIGELLDRAKPGDKVTIEFTDPSGQQQTKTLTLMEGPAD